MRILLSVFACQPGAGSERGIAWVWATDLAREHEVVALTDGSHRADIEAEVAARPRPSLRFLYLGSGLRGRSGLDRIRYYHHWQRLALAEARRQHAAAPFDVVHHLTFGSHRLPSHLGRVGPPFIWGPVGGGESAPLSFASPRWMGWRASVRELTRAASNALVRIDPRILRTVRGATVVAATTEQTRRALPSVPGTRTVVVQAAVVPRDELELLARRTPEPGPAEGLRVMYAGRLLGWKGLGLAIEGFATYASGHPKARFDIYGDGRFRSWLQRRIDRRGLHDSVVLHGRVPRGELLKRYADHHLFLFPSLHDSGGYVTLEAQAAGLPVVCLDTGGPGAIVPPEAGAKIALTRPSEVVTRIADALTALTADVDRWTAASGAARAHALDPTTTPPVEDRIAVLHGLATDRR